MHILPASSPFILLLCGALLAAPAARAAEPPVRIEASYEVSKGSIRAVAMTETYFRLNSRYTLESVSVAIGLLAVFKAETIRVTSTGTITPHGLRPDAYASKRKLDTERDNAADLHWDKHQITLRDKAGQRTSPLPADTQDRLSAMYQLMFLPLQNMKELRFHMTNGSKVDEYVFIITPGQSVDTPAGKVRALHLATPPASGENRTEIWVDEEHHFPYKLVITEPDGGKFTQVLTRIQFTR